jgi:hypothetical protein
MAKESGLRIGSLTAAVVLLAASAIAASFAAEGRSGKTSVKPVAPGHLRWRQTTAPSTSEPAVRNAIGVPVVVRHQGVERLDRERHDFPSALRSPAAAATGVAGSGTGGVTRVEGDLGGSRIVHPNAGPTVTATALNRARISGTGVVRPGSGPSALGGPARAAHGINGTLVRPKH